jgi:hypothetical protein
MVKTDGVILSRFDCTVEKASDPVGQECLAKTWLYDEANGGCAGEELKARKYFY